MPELPEVETVRRGLARLVAPGTRVTRVRVLNRDLRRKVSRTLARRLEGEAILGFRRVGKYLLWDTQCWVLLSHLGMSGTWRLAVQGEERRHDHCYIELAGGRRLAYHDPRRFGLLALAAKGSEGRHEALRELGPDPLDAAAFDSGYLYRALRRRSAPVKSLLLDQKVVAGLGNIYAQEALFRAGIRPGRRASSVSLARAGKLVEEIRAVLAEAIDLGGSTLRDFRGAEGGDGAFQERFLVYGRDGLPCRRCGSILSGRAIGGRGTTWCRRCQE